MKKIFIALLFSVLFLTCFVWVGCGDDQEENDDFKTPVISDIVADVSDKPEGIFLGSAKLKSLSLNGNTVSLVEYLARNEWFIFTADYYGEYGVGDFEYTFEFENYQAVRMKLTVRDGKTPDYSLPTSNFYTYSTGNIVELPAVVRNLMYQNYISEYRLSKDGNTVFATDDNGGEREPVAYGIESGAYDYSITIRKGGEIIGEKNCDIFIGNGDNVFSENYFSEWRVQAEDNVDFEYIAEYAAFKVKSKIDNTDQKNQLTSNNRRIYLGNVSSLVNAYDDEGYDEYNFYYYSGLRSGAGNNIGFRLYALNSSKNNQTELFTVKGNDLVDGQWTKITIKLKNLFKIISPQEFYGISIVCVGATDSYIMFRCGYFSKEPEYPDIFDEHNYQDWIIVQSAFVSTEFDEGYKINRLSDTSTAANHLGNRNRRVVLTDTASLRSAIEQGYTNLEFEYYSTLNASSGYYGIQFFVSTNHSGSSWSNEVEIARYTVENNIDKGLVSNAWTSVTIDISVIDISTTYKDEVYLSIGAIGEQGGYVVFRNASFSDENGNIYNPNKI